MIHKRSSFGSARHWLDGHQITLQRYLQTFYPPYDWRLIRHFFYENSIQGRIILKDFSKSNYQKLKEVAQLFIEGKSKIVYIVGARGSGKTATAFMFAETIHNEINRPIFYIATTINASALPKWCSVIETINEAPKGCFAMIDETAIQFNAREFHQRRNIDMTKILTIARHKEIFLIFLTQDTALADTNIRRLRDIVIWKQANDYNLTERGSRNTKEQKFWQKVRNMMAPRTRPECLFEYPAQKRFIHFSHDLPECWSDELSKSWKDMQFIRKKEDEIINPKKIKNKEVLIL